MQDGQNKVLEFDGFGVDLDAALLRSGGRVIETEPQVFELIAFLCTNPGRLIGYDEIIDKVWHGRIVSDAAIATRINAARKALGDDGTAQRVIKTVRGRGPEVPTRAGQPIDPSQAQPSVPDGRARPRPPDKSRRAIDRRSALPQHVAGRRAGILRRRHRRGHHHRIVPRYAVLRHRTQLDVCLQGQDPSTSAKSGASWACATCWKGACESPATEFA